MRVWDLSLGSAWGGGIVFGSDRQYRGQGGEVEGVRGGWRGIGV